MRVRNRKGATELLEANPQYVVLNPAEAKGKYLAMTIQSMSRLVVEKGLLYQEWPNKILTLTISELIFRNLS